jgi:phage shock protein PspC (stress-responsive transcriptional regulator)
MSEPPTGGPAPAAARYGLMRPLQGRYLAGVSGALARATGTDPVLWRVVLAVLICFGGIGVVIYALVWLLVPEEGDTASPVEALLGRGHSNTSPVMVVVLSAITVFLLVFILSRPLYLLLLGTTVILAVMLLNHHQHEAPPPGAPAPPAPGPAPPAPAPAPPPGRPPAGWHDTGYREPFAPHGPFAPPGAAAAPKPARRSRRRSAVPALTFFASLATLGVLGVLDVTGAVPVPAPGYLAAALAVVGVGLLIGAWLGGARSLIAFGVVLALALPAAQALDTWEVPEPAGDRSWAPTAVADLQDDYAVTFGAGVLDLRGMDLAGQEVTVSARVIFGELRILVPEDVAVEADVTTSFAAAAVLGSDSEGFARETFRDPGGGDPGEGLLRLRVNASFADMEVHR